MDRGVFAWLSLRSSFSNPAAEAAQEITYKGRRSRAGEFAARGLIWE
jgi:hypothetical protein